MLNEKSYNIGRIFFAQEILSSLRVSKYMKILIWIPLLLIETLFSTVTIFYKNLLALNVYFSFEPTNQIIRLKMKIENIKFAQMVFCLLQNNNILNLYDKKWGCRVLEVKVSIKISFKIGESRVDCARHIIIQFKISKIHYEILCINGSDWYV